MKGKRITGRELRHGVPEEQLSPGQSIVIEKRGGKRFTLTRTDSGPVDFNSQMDEIFREIPIDGKRARTNLARALIEERGRPMLRAQRGASGFSGPASGR